MDITSKKFTFDLNYGVSIEKSSLDIFKKLLNEQGIPERYLYKQCSSRDISYSLKKGKIAVYKDISYHGRPCWELQKIVELSENECILLKSFAQLSKILFPEERLINGLSD